MNYSKGDVVLLPYPFTNLKTTKVRPAVVAATEEGRYADVFVVPVTSRIENLTHLPQQHLFENDFESS